MTVIIVVIIIQRVDFNKEKIDLELYNSENTLFILRNVELKSNVYRIVILGDSVVESGCPDVVELERLLNENNRLKGKFNVVNAGKAGRAIDELYLNLEVIREELDYDLLLILTGWNEQWYNVYDNPCVNAGCYDEPELGLLLLNESNNKNAIIRYLSSHGYNYWQKKNAEACLEQYEYHPSEFLNGLDHFNTSIYRLSVEKYEEMMKKMIEEEKNMKKEVFLIVPPNGLEDGKVPIMPYSSCLFLDSSSFMEVHNLYIENMINLSKELSVGLIRLDQTFEATENYRSKFFSNPDYDPIHPNEVGKEVCTKAFYDEVSGFLYEKI